jgi:hypothetical protein
VETVLILGAGFSRAISSEMPLTDELGNLIRERVPEASQRSPRGFKGGYFEAWLSRLAEPQPDLTEHANWANRALFLKIADALHYIMLEREAAVLSAQVPWWLQRLIGVMHASRAAAITFNYDTLVEQAAESRILYDWEQHRRAQSVHLVRDTPPPPSRGWLATGPADTFRLLKLHGSLDCYWVPGDTSGSTISRWRLQGTWGNPQPVDEELRRQSLPGRSPFIVPPAAAKSAFYDNPISRELWRSAAEALRRADSVALIGYSLPATDLVFSGMISDTIARDNVKVDIVNKDPEGVAERLKTLGVPADNIGLISGKTPAEAYADELEKQAAAQVGTQLMEADPSRLLLLGDSEMKAALVIGLERGDDGVLLRIGDIGHTQQVTELRNGISQTTVATGTLHQVLGEGSPVKVRYPNGRIAQVVSIAEWNTNIGLGDGRWNVLVPSAMEPGG